MARTLSITMPSILGIVLRAERVGYRRKSVMFFYRQACPQGSHAGIAFSQLS